MDWRPKAAAASRSGEGEACTGQDLAAACLHRVRTTGDAWVHEPEAAGSGGAATRRRPQPSCEQASVSLCGGDRSSPSTICLFLDVPRAPPVAGHQDSWDWSPFVSGDVPCMNSMICR